MRSADVTEGVDFDGENGGARVYRGKEQGRPG